MGVLEEGRRGKGGAYTVESGFGSFITWVHGQQFPYKTQNTKHQGPNDSWTSTRMLPNTKMDDLTSDLTRTKGVEM